MRAPRPSLLALLLPLCLSLAASGCAQEEYPASLWNAQHAAPDAAATGSAAGAGADASVSGPRVCVQTHAQSLPARLVAMSASASSGASVVLVADLFQRFAEVCGACHGPAVDPPGQGSFQIIRAADFPSLMTPAVIEHLTGSVCPGNPNPSDPKDPMPPCSSPNGASYSARSESDPVRQLAELVQGWLDAGKPSSFTPTSASGADAGADAGGVSQLVLTPHDGNAMTNIGNCVPSASMFAIEDSKSAALDSLFTSLQPKPGGTALQAIGLPERLSDTDLFTLDSATLAQYGVVAYAPGYPLWSDSAGKLRHVRVPRGQSIHFNGATQQFEIPPNTRFYKTFMKEIVDTDGSYRYRKIETRLIVARPDTTSADGSAVQNALFGSYQWNDSESEALLVQTPLNDGAPFADTVLTYDVDEPLAADILAGKPADPEEALIEAQATRHYAIPSSQRCIQCHMGSSSQSFVLGFTPLQINRRPVTTGGVIEATGPDELTQLQRFIDAGIVTGLASAEEVVTLEQSQGTRSPRNQYELIAQGYMLGNCVHCHNPRGFPTVQNPVLQGVLDFLPSATGGIFQFPLERYSPRIGRGLTGTTPIPYITPSLVDLPKNDPYSGGQAGDWFVSAGPGAVYYVDYAPWRSILYRNVDAAFAYTDDFAIFPHMPMNTPGFDPRGRQIFGDWMVSIPAVRKHPEIPEYAYQTDDQAQDNVGGPVVDTTPQPYVEVLPGQPGHDQATLAAQQRLSIFHIGMNPAITIATGGVVYSRYKDPGDTSDVVDPAVTVDPICHPIPQGTPTTTYNPLPEHPHWVTTDLTSPPGPWAPRQPNWVDVLVNQNLPPPGSGCAGLTGQQAAYQDEVIAVSLLPDITLNQVQPFVTTPVPFGLWQKKPGCDFSKQPTAGSFTGAQRPHWMDVAGAAADAPVFSQAPGAAVFKMICINCHGPLADSNGRLAQNLATMTGGNALVANFRDGLFGPVGASEAESNRHAQFGASLIPSGLPADVASKWTGVTDDDRAARYVAWMGLGGTPVNIPVAVLQVVAVTKVLDQIRTLDATQLSANMLSQAKALCLGTLGPGYVDSSVAQFIPGDGHGYLDAPVSHLNRALIFSNGDAELWLRLCSLANPSPIHVLSFPVLGASIQLQVAPIQDVTYAIAVTPGQGLVPSSVYPAGAPVGNMRGGVDASLSPDNEWPWCVDASAAKPAQDEFIAVNNLPVCPPPVQASLHACNSNHQGCFGTPEANRWALQGAINAGLAVFSYVSSIESSSPPPDFNQCEQLK